MHSCSDEQAERIALENSATKPGLGRILKSMKPRSKANCNWSTICRKLFTPLGAVTVSFCFGCTFVMDQGLSEPIAVRHCYAAIRDNKIKATDECSVYAQRHQKLYSDIDQSSPERATCAFSEYALAHARRLHPYELIRISKLAQQRKEDC